VTHDEFDEWFAAHAASFTGVGSWFRGMAGRSIDTDDVMRNWYRVLAETDLCDAVDATRAMFADTVDVHFDRHPATVRAIAAKLGAKRRLAATAKTWTKTEPRVHCADCLDSGYRRCVHPKTVAEYRDGIGGYIYTCVAACPCASGLHAFPDEKYPRYDETRCCLIEVRTTDGITMATQEQAKAMLLEWLEWRKQASIERSYADQWQPANGSSYQASISNGFEGY
jgi:hypothetical protein